jgi:hypothetical protein
MLSVSISDSKTFLSLRGINATGLSRDTPGELPVILRLINPYCLFSRIQDSLHQQRRDEHEAAASHHGGQAIVMEQVIHHPSEEQ